MLHNFSKVQFALRLFMYNCSFQLREHKQKLYIAYLTSWHFNLLGYKLRTD